MYLQLTILLLLCLIFDCIDWDDEIGAESGADETWSPLKESQVNKDSEEESDEFEDSGDSSSDEEYIPSFCVRYVYNCMPLAMYVLLMLHLKNDL